ncbi:hypothetical protein [Pseudovibrio brasiliensis]|uniref:Histidine kinase n=1 Tax=Pseudovibrio brasiliensis TaxID=1898042 RepID=A0ABX8ALE4_9HYPH|nr:hypothetical protein [Pseudovibrio brasiliensis]QUS55082.1 hypothetical protein KGB56_17205 [Pseudovibrio brasiliensis]
MYSDQYFSSDVRPTKKKKSAPEKRFYLLEVAVLFAPFPVLASMHPELLIWSIAPSPLWIPIIIASSIFGTRSGILSALTALALTLWYVPPQPIGGQNFFEYFTTTGLEPTLWLLTAIIFGEFRTSLLRKNQRLQNQLTQALGQRDTISDYCTTLTMEAENLQSRIASMETTSPVSVFKSIDRLSTLHLKNSPKQLDIALGNLIGATKFSLFSYTSDHLDLVHSNIATSSGVASHSAQQEQTWLINHLEMTEITGNTQQVITHTPKGSLVLLLKASDVTNPKPDHEILQGAIIFHQLEQHVLEEDTTILLETIGKSLAQSLANHNAEKAPDNLISLYSINTPPKSNRLDNSVL